MGVVGQQKMEDLLGGEEQHFECRSHDRALRERRVYLGGHGGLWAAMDGETVTVAGLSVAAA